MGLAVRKQRELGNLLFPCPVIASDGRSVTEHTSGTVKQVLALRLGCGEFRSGCWAPGLLLPHSSPSLYDLGHAALCCTFQVAWASTLTVGYRMHGSGGARWEI